MSEKESCNRRNEPSPTKTAMLRRLQWATNIEMIWSSTRLKRKKDIEQDVFSLVEMIMVPGYIPLEIKKDFENSSQENCETSASQL